MHKNICVCRLCYLLQGELAYSYRDNDTIRVRCAALLETPSTEKIQAENVLRVWFRFGDEDKVSIRGETQTASMWSVFEALAIDSTVS